MSARPDELVRTQNLKGAGHLRTVEKALLPHHIVEERELALVGEELQLARLGEISLRRQQRDRREPLISVARHRCRGDREQGAAEAIADGMDFLRAANRRDRIERRHHAKPAVVIERNIA